MRRLRVQPPYLHRFEKNKPLNVGTELGEHGEDGAASRGSPVRITRAHVEYNSLVALFVLRCSCRQPRKLTARRVQERLRGPRFPGARRSPATVPSFPSDSGPTPPIDEFDMAGAAPPPLP